ncbi:ankyrin repeat domain-containing protein [Gimesia benthica]|uniref:Ankyrin repeat domain-containing protein n=1 Tax=Gimesia benthica TaxID=2608982 RepID=A0A6I6AEB0_9PLAN|nr:ankyrin repeat domain-containing protein [Gimesia benthica]QGQ23952.1 ankyrin repeat domain-containing protein [Gimesia benthica]
MSTDPFNAVELKKPDALEIIEALDDINIRDDYGATLLHSAIAYDNTPVGLELIRRGLDVNAKTKKGLTPLHFCAIYQNLELTRAILENGGDLSIADKNGNTPLLDAVGNPKRTYDLLKLFAEYSNPEIASQKNNYGISPLELAKNMGDEAAVGIISTA